MNIFSQTVTTSSTNSTPHASLAPILAPILEEEIEDTFGALEQPSVKKIKHETRTPMEIVLDLPSDGEPVTEKQFETKLSGIFINQN